MKEMTLTEQWKKGELEWGKNYYCRNVKTNETNICFLYGSTWYSADSDGEGDIDWQGSLEVLAPVPSYEEWKQLHKFLEEFNALDVAKENQQLKDLLSECNEFLYEILAGTQLKLSFKLESGIRKQRYMISLSELKTKIDNAIGEKK